MRPASALILCSALACGPRKPAAPTVVPDPPPAEEKVEPPGPLDDLDASVERVLDAFGVPGASVAIVKDGKVVVAKGYGERERGKKELVDADTSFAIASNTKAFVATVLAMLEHEKKLSLDDRVKDRLPRFEAWDAFTTSEMRLRDLITHRGGLDTWAGDVMWIGSKIDTKTLLARLRHLPAKHGLRSGYGYCNITFAVAGEVIRAVTGKAWDVVVRERLLDPIGMKRTTTTIDALPKLGNVATPHSMQGEDEAAVVDVYVNVDNAGPAGALNSSAADMGRWLVVQLSEGQIDGKAIVPPEVLQATRVAHTAIPVKPDDALGRHLQAYGLGWFLYDYRGRGVVTHGGGLFGMTSRVTMVPEEGLGIVVLTNSESPASGLIAIQIVDAFLGGERPDHLANAQKRKAAKKSKAKAEAKLPEGEPPSAKAVLGTYKSPLLGKAVVADTDGLLELRLPDHGGLDCPLVAQKSAAYRCEWSNPIFGVSQILFNTKRGRATDLRFRVRPQFIDPLEYTFKR